MNVISHTHTLAQSRKWIGTLNTPKNPVVRLVCFSFAGGGPSTYRNWVEYFPDSVELLAVQLPGRDMRFSEPLEENYSAVEQAIVLALHELPNLPTVFFGHSMGSLVSFHIALRIGATFGTLPRHLILSGCYPPHISKPDDLDLRWKECDIALQEKMENLSGTPDEVLQDTQLREIVLPIFRSDLLLSEQVSNAIRGKVNMSLTVMGGNADPKVDREDLEQWAQYTSKDMSLLEFEGDHFFIDTVRAEVCSAVLDCIKRINPELMNS